jgi:hypothetical protein
VLEDTLAGVLDRFPELASLCLVPLGVSDHHREARMRAHTTAEARAVVDLVAEWQQVYLDVLGHRLVFAGDEYYLMAGVPFPAADTYEGFAMHEDGVGMARTFELELLGATDTPVGPRSGFFAAVDGAPAEGYRAPRLEGRPRGHGDDDGPPDHDRHGHGCCGPDPSGTGTPDGEVAVRPSEVGGGGVPASAGGGSVPVALRARAGAPIAILSGTLGARVLEPLVSRLGLDDVRVVPVENRFFGGTTGVTGLLVGSDLARVLADEPPGHRYLLPDVCLSGGTFLDDTTPHDLPRPVEVVPTDGVALRRILDEHRAHGADGWRRP